MTSDTFRYNGLYEVLDADVIVDKIRDYEYDNILICTFEAALEKETTLKIEVYTSKLRFVYERWDRWDNKVNRAKSIPISHLSNVYRTDLFTGVKKVCINAIRDIINESIVPNDKIEDILYRRQYLHCNTDESYYETYEHLRYNLSNILDLVFN